MASSDRHRFYSAAALGLIAVPAGILLPLLVTLITKPLWGLTGFDVGFFLALNFGSTGMLAGLAYSALLFLLPLVIVAAIAWRGLGSFRLALVSCVPAFLIQMSVGIVSNLTMRSAFLRMHRQEEARLSEQRARIQVVSVTAETSDTLATRFKYYGPAYQRLHLDLTMDCKKAGTYEMRLRCSPAHQSGYDVYHDQQIRLTKGRNLVPVDLSADMFPIGGYWFRYDSTRVEVRIYQVSQLPKPLLGPRPTPGSIVFLEKTVPIPELTAFRPDNFPH